MPPRPRKENPVKFLDASTQHVEDALLARADALEKEADEYEQPGGETWFFTRRLSIELRSLAKELHYW